MRVATAISLLVVPFSLRSSPTRTAARGYAAADDHLRPGHTADGRAVRGSCNRAGDAGGQVFVCAHKWEQQVKHLVTVNDRLAEAITGQAPPTAPDERITSNGPNAVQAKDQIMQYLNHSATCTRPSPHSMGTTRWLP